MSSPVHSALSLDPSAAFLALADTLLVHLRCEAVALADAADALGRLHEALLQADLEGLCRAQPAQEKLAARLERLRDQRRDLIVALAEATGIAATAVTVRDLIARCPPQQAEQLEQARLEVAQLAGQVDSLNRRTASLAQLGVGFVRGCLTDLYGDQPRGRYGRAGLVPEPPRGCLLEAQG